MGFDDDGPKQRLTLKERLALKKAGGDAGGPSKPATKVDANNNVATKTVTKSSEPSSHEKTTATRTTSVGGTQKETITRTRFKQDGDTIDEEVKTTNIRKTPSGNKEEKTEEVKKTHKSTGGEREVVTKITTVTEKGGDDDEVFTVTKHTTTKVGKGDGKVDVKESEVSTSISSGDLKSLPEPKADAAKVDVKKTNKFESKFGAKPKDAAPTGKTAPGKAAPAQSVEEKMKERKRQQEAEKKLRTTSQRGKPSTKTNMFKVADQNNPKQKLSQKSSLGGGEGRSADSNIDKLLQWVARRVNQYPCVEVNNFSSSWKDGIAFCALYNYLLGNEAIPPEKVSGDDARANFELAFKVGEEHGVPALLDVDDMVAMKEPDRRSVITYVHTIYKVLVQDKEKK